MIKRAKGFTLIEMAFVIAIFGVILMTVARYSGAMQERAFGRVGGSQLKELIGDGSKFMAANFDSLVNGVAVTGIANEYAPTFAELKALGLIQASVPTVNEFGSQWNFIITKQPAACVAPNCDLQVTVNTTAPVLYKGKINYDVLKNISDEVGNDASYSEDTDAGNIHGVNNSWVVVNPVLPAVPGIVLARAGFGSQGLSQFVRQGDSRNIVLNGGITNNGTLTSNGNVNLSGANGINLTSGNITTVYGSMTAQNVTAQNALGAGGSFNNYGYFNQYGNQVNSGTLTVAGAVTAGTVTTGALTSTTSSLGTATASNLTAVNGLSAQSLTYTAAIVTPGAACAPNGLTGRFTDGSLYSCTSGLWVSTSAKPCVHGNWSSNVPGTHTVTIPAECIDITVAGYGGAGGGGLSIHSSGIVVLGSGGGGSTGLTTQVVKRPVGNVSATFTAVVGWGGWNLVGIGGWECGYWTLCYNSNTYGNGENSSLSTAAPAATLQTFYGGGSGLYNGGGGVAGTGGVKGNNPSGYYGGNGANAPVAGGASGGGGTGGFKFLVGLSIKETSTGFFGAAGTGVSPGSAATVSYTVPFYARTPLAVAGWPATLFAETMAYNSDRFGSPGVGGNGYLSVSW